MPEVPPPARLADDFAALFHPERHARVCTQLAYREEFVARHDYFLHIWLDGPSLSIRQRAARDRAMATGNWDPANGYILFHYQPLLRYSYLFWILLGKPMARFFKPLAARVVAGGNLFDTMLVCDIGTPAVREQLAENLERLCLGLDRVPDPLPTEAMGCLLQWEGMEYPNQKRFVLFLYRCVIGFTELALKPDVNRLHWLASASPRLSLPRL